MPRRSSRLVRGVGLAITGIRAGCAFGRPPPDYHQPLAPVRRVPAAKTQHPRSVPWLCAGYSTAVSQPSLRCAAVCSAFLSHWLGY